MPQITLYGPANIPFTTKVRGALALKKLDYELREPSGPEDFKRWSPTGLLPAIDIDGTVTPDSSAILDKLDELFPEPPLVSDDPKIAGSQRRLEAWMEATFTFYWQNYLSQIASGEGERRRRRRPVEGEGLGGEYARRLDDLVNFLGGRPFFYGDRVSRADLAMYSFLHRMPALAAPEVERETLRRAALVEHMARIEQAVGPEFA